MDNIYLKVFFDLIHILATITWFGAMFTNNVLVRPIVLNELEPQQQGVFMGKLMKKTRIVVYISLAMLFITGIPMKIVSEYYVSIINFSNNWQIVTFIKHVLVALLALLAIYTFELLAPAMQKAAKQSDTNKLNKLKKRQAVFGKASFLFAFLILLLSAVMNYIN